MLTNDEINQARYGPWGAGLKTQDDVCHQAKDYITLVEFINTLNSNDGGTAVLDQLGYFIDDQEKE